MKVLSMTKTTESEDPFGLKARYEAEFGENSWQELERGVRERHPEFFKIYDALEG